MLLSLLTFQIFNRANPSTPAWEADCGYSPDCIYSGQTVLFVVRNASWVFGAHYYVLLGSGAASGNVFCAPESAPITDPNFWNFNIWDPGQSSTTSTTTTSTAPPLPTVTTRAPSTTTPNLNLTTTGIVVTNATQPSIATTTTTSTTSSTSTTSVTATTRTTTVSVNVLTAKEMEEQCRQPVAITTAASSVMMLVVHVIGMFTMFTKIEKLFNPSRLAAKARQDKLFNRLSSNGK